MAIKIAKVVTKFCLLLIKTSKKLPKAFKILQKWQNFAKSDHTAVCAGTILKAIPYV